MSTWYIPEVGDDPYLFLGHKVKVQESNCFIYYDHVIVLTWESSDWQTSNLVHLLVSQE